MKVFASNIKFHLTLSDPLVINKIIRITDACTNTINLLSLLIDNAYYKLKQYASGKYFMYGI